MKRRILSLLLAVCMMIGFCIPAWATGTGDITATTAVNAAPINSGQFVETTLTGTFSYTQLKVTVPTAIAFSLDPTKTVTKDNPRAQVTGGEFVVSNYSVSPLYLHVYNMSYNSSSVGFTTSASDITSNSRKIYFSMYSDTDAKPDLSGNTLAQTDSVSYCTGGQGYRYLVTKNAIAAGSDSTPTERTCYIAARAGLGFDTGDSFDIKLTFVIDRSSSVYTSGTLEST